MHFHLVQHVPLLLNALAILVVGMAVAVPDATAVATKWSTRANAAQTSYNSGVKNPKRDWAQSTLAAEPAYDSGVQLAIGRKAYSRGAQKTGTAGWQAATTSKASRFGQGVQDPNAQAKMQNGIAPYLQTISSLTLPARGPRGSQGNYQIPQIIGQALSSKKQQLQGGGQ